MSAEDHACGVTTDNRAYCWGHNADGEIGDGTTTNRSRPVAVATALRFRQISAGTHHTCGVTTDFRAFCWGYNYYGELGDGTTTTRLKPVAVAGGHQFRQVNVGVYHTCGVRYPDNRAYCWGQNNDGELGIGTATVRNPTPVAVAGDRQFREVSAGYFHTCGLTTSNVAFCWGSNQYGQIGDSSTAFRRLTPTRVAGTRQFRQMDTGLEHTCAVTTDYRAFCWGYGRTGEIGDGKTYLRFWPRAVAGGLQFERLSAGSDHTCGETTLNRAYCWGGNALGQLGDGTTSQRLTPVAVAGGLYFSQVSAGSGETCGRTPSAVAYCWGNNHDGQLGDGTTTNRSKPVKVVGPT